MKLSAPRTQRPDLEQKGHDNKNSMKQETHYLTTKDNINPMNNNLEKSSNNKTGTKDKSKEANIKQNRTTRD